ncbi:MAG: hypothetical protein Q8Q09_05890 [Deltaproteobacteria bacterium]|nr:hypothetical protein [Deltaproteobacteria bacterium]
MKTQNMGTAFVLGCALALGGGEALAQRSWLRREVVASVTERAVAYSGLGGDAASPLVARARWAAWMPRISVRVGRGLTSSSSLAVGLSDSERNSSNEALSFEIRATMDLSRVVAPHGELEAQRWQGSRVEQRHRVAREVMDTLAILERHRLTVAQLAVGTVAVMPLDVRRARAQVELWLGADAWSWEQTIEGR